MSDNPYIFKDDGIFRTINFSGGRSSGFMLHNILQAYDGKLPENCCVVFTNTGKEREETLVFVDRCSKEWEVPIVWLEYWM